MYIYFASQFYAVICHQHLVVEFGSCHLNLNCCILFYCLFKSDSNSGDKFLIVMMLFYCVVTCYCRKPRARPVITIVDAKPMSETGFRQEQKPAERPKPSPRDPNKSPWSSSPPSPGNVGLVQIVPDSKPDLTPVKPQRNFTVKYDPQSTNATSNDGSRMEPKRSISPENVTTSTTHPVPRPRPRSTIKSQSESTCISVAQIDGKTDKLPTTVHPEAATRSTQPVTKPCILQPTAQKVPKGYHVIGSSVWYDGNTRAPPQRPPPVKPKPVVSPTSEEPKKTIEGVQLTSAKVPADVVRRKPTIIRATPTVEPTVGSSASTMVAPPQSEIAVNTTSNSATVVSGAEVNGWSKPTPQNPQLGSDTSADAGLSDAAKPQAKKRPTIIKRSRPDTISASEQPAISTDEKPSQAPSQSSVEVSHRTAAAVQGLESPTAAVLERSEDRGTLDRGTLPATGRPAANEGSEDHNLKPVPRSSTLPRQSTEQELSRKIPPSKPPPPTLSNTAEEHRAPV